MGKCVFQILSVMLISSGSIWGAQEAPLQTPTPPWEVPEWADFKSEMSSANADKFSQWADEQLKESDKSKSIAVALIKVMLTRIEEGSFVSDLQIRGASGTILYEQKESRKSGSVISEMTLNIWARIFFAAVFNKAKHPSTRIMAGRRFADLIFQTASKQEGIAILKKVVAEAEKVDLENMYILQMGRCDLGMLHLQQDHKPEAEKYLLDVASYPWALLRGGDNRQRFRDIYCRAMTGLVSARRGKLQELMELDIILAPACRDIVGPFLKDMIKEAENKK